MIEAKCLWSGGEKPKLRLTVKGHAGCGEYGEDVVCAAVSSLVQTLADKVQQAMRAGAARGMIRREEGNAWTVEAEPIGEAADSVAGWFDFAEEGLRSIAASWPTALTLESVADAEWGDGENGQNLQLFAEGGGGDGGAAAAAAEGAGTDAASSPEGQSQEKTPARKGGRQSSRAQARAQVEAMLEPESREKPEEKTPEPDGDQGGQEDQSQGEEPGEKQKRFREMVRGEYRAEFEESIQQAVRVSLQRLMGENTQLGGLLDTLAKRYNTEPGDLEALTAAVEQGEKGEDYYENLALEKGVSVRLAKEMDAMETELQRRRSAEQRQQRQAEIQRIHAQWDAEAQRLHEADPEFDIREALKNPTFAAVLKSGVPMEAAYQAAYFDRILERSTASTAQKVERGVEERIRQRGTRPAENGTNPGGAATLKTDVTKLTKAQREELERQVRMGKIIHL